MNLLSSLRAFASALFRRSRVESEMDEELRAHIENRAEDLERSGVSRAEAKRRARLEFGGYQKFKEECREAVGVHFFETLMQDLRYALRMLRKSPGFTLVAVFTLALGIGANTAIFSVTYDILLKPLPYPDSSRLVQLWVGNPAHGRMAYIRSRDFREVASQSHIFAQLGEYLEGGSTITGPEGPEGVQTSYISGDFFSVLGARPLLGRPILPSDAEPGHDQVAVLSYDLWQRKYGGDPRIVGKQLTLTNEGEAGNTEDNSPRVSLYRVVGIMPARFPFPNHGDLLLPQESWGHQFQLIAIGRLKQGVSLATANAELHTIAARIAAESPAHHKNFDLFVGLLRDRMSEGYSTELLILLGAVGFLLLLACANLSSLLIGRSWVRQKEVAVRETLGATRWRLIRQSLSESLLLALLGAAAGILLAYWGINLLRSMAPQGTPRLDELGIDSLVLAYALAISLLSVILFGLAPALQITRRWPGEALKAGLTGGFAGLHFNRPQRLKDFLVAAEIALVFVLVVGSALALRSFSNLMNVNLGFRPTHVLTMFVNFSPAIRVNLNRYHLAVNEVLERTRALPGIENSAFGEWLPIGGSSTEGELTIQGSSYSGMVECQVATPGYFSTLGIPLVAGRSFNEDDSQNFASAPGQQSARPSSSESLVHPEKRPSSLARSRKSSQKDMPLVAIVNEVFAKKFFDGNALGKQFRGGCFSGDDLLQIVGEVGDVRDESRHYQPIPEIYTPIAQTQGFAATTLLVRTAADPMAMAKAVREQISAVDPNAPVDGLRTMDAVMSERVAEPRFDTMLLSVFGALSLLLAAIGIYGLISYSVRQRTHEIGVRMALGAGRGDVLRMVLGEGLLLASLGIAIGVAGALALTRFLRSLLFEIKPTDPATFIAVAILLALVALAACYIPARRAMRVDPMVALRYE